MSLSSTGEGAWFSGEGAGPSLEKDLRTREGRHGSLMSLTDVLEKVHGIISHGSLRSLTDEAGIIYVMKSCMVLSGSSLMRQESPTYWRRWMVLPGPSLMRYVSSA